MLNRFTRRGKMDLKKYSLTEYHENLKCLADEAIVLFHTKQKEYEDNWQDVEVEELASVMKTKATAFANQVKNKGDPDSILHHAADMMNWVTMLACRGVEQ